MPPKWATEEDKAKRLKKNREQKAARRKLLQQQESADDKQKRLMHQRQSKAASRERSLSAKRKVGISLNIVECDPPLFLCAGSRVGIAFGFPPVCRPRGRRSSNAVETSGACGG